MSDAVLIEQKDKVQAPVSYPVTEKAQKLAQPPQGVPEVFHKAFEDTPIQTLQPADQSHQQLVANTTQHVQEAGFPHTPQQIHPQGESKTILEKIQDTIPGATSLDEALHDIKRLGPQVVSGSHYMNLAKPGRGSIVMERARKLAGKFGRPVILTNLLSPFKKQRA
jgi:hypothetical protein